MPDRSRPLPPVRRTAAPAPGARRGVALALEATGLWSTTGIFIDPLVSLLTTLEPPITAVLALVLLGRAMSAPQWLGTTLIVAGVLLIQGDALRVHGRLDPARGELMLRCPGCDTRPGVSYAYARGEGFFDGVKGYKPALNRLSRWLTAYWATLADGAIPCARCGRPTAWRTGPDADEPGVAHAAWIECRACRRRTHSALSGLALGRPDAQRFWRDNPRIRLLPERAVEAAGRDALVTGFQSVTGAATLTVVAARDTYEVIAVHGASER